MRLQGSVFERRGYTFLVIFRSRYNKKYFFLHLPADASININI